MSPGYKAAGAVHALRVFLITILSYLALSVVGGMIGAIAFNVPTELTDDQITMIDSINRLITIIIYFIVLRWSATKLTALYSAQASKIALFSAIIWVVLYSILYIIDGMTSILTAIVPLFIGSLVFFYLTKRAVSGTPETSFRLTK